MATIRRPGGRDVVLDRSGNLTPRWSRYFDELAGLTAEPGDVLVVGSGGAEYAPGETATLSQDIEFFEYWRG